MVGCGAGDATADLRFNGRGPIERDSRVEDTLQFSSIACNPKIVNRKRLELSIQTLFALVGEKQKSVRQVL